MNIKKIIMSGAASAIMLGAMIAPAFATSYTTFGDSSIVSGGNPGNMAKVTSGATSPGYGGVSFTLPSGVSVVNDLSTLGTDYQVLVGDCGGGSPRFSIEVNGGGNIFVYLGPTPSFTSCLTGWQTSGNLLSDADLRVDTSQVGGTFYDTWAHAQTLVGTQSITNLSVVVDGSWAVGGTQSFGFDNVTINNDVTTFDPVLVGPATDKDQCKDNGWKTFNNPTYKNQGDCVSSVVSKGKNK